MQVQDPARDNYRLLVLAPNPWNGQWVNRQQLFSRIGRAHAVLYSTGGWFNWDRRTPEWKQAAWAGRFAPHDNVWVDASPRWLMRAPKLAALDRSVVGLQAGRWKRFLDSRGNGPLVTYVYHPFFLPYVKPLAAKHLVYHAYDLYDHTPGWNDALERNERDLLASADLVVAASDQIAEALHAKVAREIRVLPNGADVGAFDRALQPSSPQPADLSGIARPRLGWVGSLHPQVDYGLIAELARRRPDWQFVLVGQVVPHPDARAERERADCQAQANVHFLGGKPIDVIAGYVANMDVNLMCYRLSDESWIKAIYPLKLHEYLAAGHPVVSSDVPSVRPFSDVVRIADGVNDWQSAITDALLRGGKGNPQARRRVAADNSWDSRVRLLNTWLSNLVRRRVPEP